jgi:hypothetical protein
MLFAFLFFREASTSEKKTAYKRLLSFFAGEEGFEPTTNTLTAYCSTTELLPNIGRNSFYSSRTIVEK